VTNNGPAAATGVTLTDPLPTNVTFVSATPSTGTCIPSTAVTCNLGSLANGASATVTLVVQPTANGTVTNTASVTANESDPVTSNNSATVTTSVAPPDLTITKTHSGSFTQGQTGATYTITVSNVGGTATAGTVTVTDTLPTGLTATAISGTGWTCTLSTLTCTRSDALAASASYPAITLTVNVASAAPASITNTATVSGGGEVNTANDTAGDPTTIIPVPTLTSLSPSSATAGGAAFTLTVNGTNFISGATVNWGASPRTATFVSPTQLTILIAGADIATAGTINVTVTNPAPGGGTSAPQTFTVNNPTPAITLISPLTAVAGTTGLTLAVTGSNFAPGSVVRWNDQDRTTTFVDGAHLSAVITTTDLALAGTAQVTVFNPTPGGGTSSAVTFTIAVSGNPVPTLTALSPDNKTAGGPWFTLTVSGVNFVPGAAVLWNGSPRVTTFVSSMQLTAEITVFDLASAGTAQVTVSNPAPGGGPSATGLPFTIHPRGSYLVGDGSPFSGYDAGKFGDDALDNLDLIVALRAVTSVPGFTPPNCSDLYDAMDAYQVDGSGRGGDGMLDNLDLIATLRRVTNADMSRPRRQTRGLICSAAAPPSRPVPMALPAESAAVGNLEFGPPEPAGIPLYLRADRELNLSALSFSLGWAGARGKLRFVAADVGAPSLLDDALPGTLAMAWLDGMQLAAGGRLLLGLIDPPGAAGELPPAFYGVKANDRQTGAAVPLATGPPTSHQDR
jgi:uncharacterized repeat protein (TIGR01451 family)